MSSKQKKKKRKGHSGGKRGQRFFNCVRAWSWESENTDDVAIAHAETRLGLGLWQDLTQQQMEGVISKNNNWVVTCRALCTTGDSDVWFETEVRSIRGIKLTELEGIYKEMYAGVLESVQERHIVDMGWIAQSYGKVDRVDENIELIHAGEITKERKAKWQKLCEDDK